MRVGNNPNKDKKQDLTGFVHQVIVPVYIPEQEGYFKDSFKILKTCLKSLFSTTHNQTFYTVVNNGSCAEVSGYLDGLYEAQKIHEIIHTHNIGKINAILKGLIGHDVPLITITDSDVLFLPKWQQETMKVFSTFPKAGTVGLVPQFNMFSNFCTNALFDNFFNKNCRFYPLEGPEGARKFYLSLGWDMSLQHQYLKSRLGICKNNIKVCMGTGHFVATYRKELFEKPKKHDPHKMGGSSEKYLDKAAMLAGYWKLTTFKNYAYHMGNSWEPWMAHENVFKGYVPTSANKSLPNNKKKPGANPVLYFVKNKIFKKLLRIDFVNRVFLRYKKMDKEELKEYPRVFY